jgi:sterol desaturase/sphingolipid hydroxylase (fatty acid hydroxylase superfamily)
MEGSTLTERATFVLLAFIAHEGPLVAYHLICNLLRRHHVCDQYLIQRSPPPRELVKQAIRQLAFGHIVIQLPLLWFMFDLFKWAGMPGLGAELPGWPSILVQFVVFMLLCDTGLYWAHRSLHHPVLYATFHKQHHSFKSNDALASEYFSPVEEVLTVCCVDELVGVVDVTAFMQSCRDSFLLCWAHFSCERTPASCCYG